MYKFYTLVVKLIHTCFILSDAVVNGIISFILFLNCNCQYIEILFFCISYSLWYEILFISSHGFSGFFEFCTKITMYSAKKKCFIFFFPTWLHKSICLSWLSVRMSYLLPYCTLLSLVKILNRSGENGHFCYVPDT